MKRKKRMPDLPGILHFVVNAATGGTPSVLPARNMTPIGKKRRAKNEYQHICHRKLLIVAKAMTPKTIATAIPAGLRSNRAMPTATAAILPQMFAISLSVSLSHSFMPPSFRGQCHNRGNPRQSCLRGLPKAR